MSPSVARTLQHNTRRKTAPESRVAHSQALVPRELGSDKRRVEAEQVRRRVRTLPSSLSLSGVEELVDPARFEGPAEEKNTDGSPRQNVHP